MTRDGQRYITVSRAGFSVRIHRRSAVVVVCGLLLVLGLSVYSLTLGDYGLSAADSFRRLLGDGGPRDDFLGVYFVQSVRLPRMLAAVAVGCALGISGRIFQTISGNPLGSPDIVGLSTGCATGALIAIIVLGSSPAVTGLGALVGGLVSGAAILACAGGMRVTGMRVVLVGIGCSAALRAINSLLIVKAPLIFGGYVRSTDTSPDRARRCRMCVRRCCSSAGACGDGGRRCDRARRARAPHSSSVDRCRHPARCLRHGRRWSGRVRRIVRPAYCASPVRWRGSGFCFVRARGGVAGVGI